MSYLSENVHVGCYPIDYMCPVSYSLKINRFIQRLIPLRNGFHDAWAKTVAQKATIWTNSVMISKLPFFIFCYTGNFICRDTFSEEERLVLY